MTVAAPQVTSATSTPQVSKIQTDKGKLSETYDNFLKLLTTQLKNQDPLAPMDSAQFTNQLVLYSQVEQQIGQNEKLEKLVSLQNASQTHASLGFIGLDVEATGDQISFEGEPVMFSYDMPSGAQTVKLQILNEAGRTVRTVDLDKTPGKQGFTWDGRNKDGETVEPGAYTVKIAAIDYEKRALEVPTTVYGRVSGIETNEKGETLLMMGTVKLTLDQIRSAVKPAA